MYRDVAQLRTSFKIIRFIVVAFSSDLWLHFESFQMPIVIDLYLAYKKSEHSLGQTIIKIMVAMNFQFIDGGDHCVSKVASRSIGYNVIMYNVKTLIL